MTTRRLFVALFLLALFTMAVRETLDPDMWWHLRTGEYILQEGLPRQDIFSFTVPDHAWVTHEWLSQLFMWLVYQVGGLPGLIVVFAAIITLTFGLVYLCCDGRPYLAAFVVLLVAVASAITWGARPQMFNLLLTAVFVFVVEGVRSGRLGRRWFWLLPALMVLWVNLHSGYLLGVVLLATYVVGEAAEQWLGGRFPGRGTTTTTRPHLDSQSIRTLALATGASFLAALLNPSGYVIWIYPFETLGSSAMQAYIQEWQPPDFHFAIFWPFAALFFLGIVSWWAGYRAGGSAPAGSDVLLFLGTGAAGLLSARHIPLFAIVAAPIVCRSLWLALAGTRLERALLPTTRQKPPGRVLALANWLLLLLAVLGAALWTSSKIMANDAAIAERYPVAAVDYLQASGLASQPGYNQYGWGGYLIWRGLPVFVDGRADVYGDPFLFYYLQTFELADNWQEPLDDYQVAYVLMDRGSPLTTLLATSDAWREAYSDAQAQIFVRVP